MGTWDVGPFDNDTAADFSGSLDEAPEAGPDLPVPELPADLRALAGLTGASRPGAVRTGRCTRAASR